ncbi:transposase family protein [Rhodococcus sp. 1168]|uniref:transposase family protein n=1 Tax=Rhodococcus sp. 1168 TaxID=2018041 RepID=UPI000F737564|nr:transposase family protein [Rhodococcus sp. 1168]
MSQSSSVLFGLDGVIVETVETGSDGRRTVGVLTAPQWVGRCPACACVSMRSKGWVSTRPRDMKIGPDRPQVVWRKRKWLCSNISCDRRTFTESIPQIPPRARITGRAKTEMALAVLDDDRCVKAVAAAYGCSWNTCHVAVVATADPILGVEPEQVSVLGIDETRRGNDVCGLGTCVTQRHRDIVNALEVGVR